ncbi:hypothetical protein MD484_g3676, partial [Candolleomyces efflorescens]
MKAFLFLIALLASCVVASNSGIFEDDGQSVTQPPGYIEQVAGDRRAEIPTIPTPTRRVTNAERLRRGISLLPPTRRSGTLRARASCIPLSNGVGKIQVRRTSDNVVLGYIRNTYDGQNSYTYGTLANSLTVQLGSTDSTVVGGAIEITAINGPDANYPRIGSVGGSAGYNFNSGQLGYTYLSGTGHTPANSPPSFSAGHSIQSLGYNAPAESTVWFVNCLTGAITAQWTNTDGSQPSTSIFYDAAVDFLGLIGDFNKFVETFPNEGAYTVSLHFIPDI